jgi:hypothetical protein
MLSPSLTLALPSAPRPRTASGAGRLAIVGLWALGLCACHAPEKPLVHTHVPSLNDRIMVLNADSLVIDGRHVHLSNASTPQSTPHSRCWSEALLAGDEIAYVRDLVAHAQTFTFTPNGKVDGYNRALGQVSLDGADLGDALYERGMAARPTDPRFDWCQPISQQAEGAPPLSAVATLSQ